MGYSRPEHIIQKHNVLRLNKSVCNSMIVCMFL